MIVRGSVVYKYSHHAANVHNHLVIYIGHVVERSGSRVGLRTLE